MGGEMGRDVDKEIQEIIGDVKCPKDFACYKSGFANLCKAQNVGLDSFIRCLYEDPKGCKLATSMGSTYLCECPIRAYIIKKLGK
jgi:hypothetical protein